MKTKLYEKLAHLANVPLEINPNTSNVCHNEIKVPVITTNLLLVQKLQIQKIQEKI